MSECQKMEESLDHKKLIATEIKRPKQTNKRRWRKVQQQHKLTLAMALISTPVFNSHSIISKGFLTTAFIKAVNPFWTKQSKTSTRTNNWQQKNWIDHMLKIIDKNIWLNYEWNNINTNVIFGVDISSIFYQYFQHHDISFRSSQ